jgi:WXG100 family type VII secretion target
VSLFGASPEQLKAAAGHVERTAQYIEGLRKGVSNTVQELVASGSASHWEGGAAIKYRQHMDAWDGACRRVIQDLETMYDNMNVGAGIYAAAEADAHDMNLGGVAANENRVDSLINVRS